jgi:hypothetical protein
MLRRHTMLRPHVALAPVLCLAACAAGQPLASSEDPAAEAQEDAALPEPDVSDAGRDDDEDHDESPEESLTDGEGCVGVKSRAELEKSPVDIVWVVDNSVSMRPAIEQVTRGINRFAERIGDSDLDYRVIMLSLRGKGAVQHDGEPRYGVCVPEPLAGDARCGNGERFFQASIDIKSTQPLEQLLGTLGQTDGYQPGEARGGAAWASQLREGATKSIVVVTDDNSRLSARDFQHFRGGNNPHNGNLGLPPGVLDASWDGLFDDYVFHGLYGWGSESNVDIACEYPGGSSPPESGATYSELVRETGGVRAQICDGSSAWEPFFEAVASSVVNEARIACDLTIPAAPDGESLDPARVNVSIRLPGAPRVALAKVAASDCGAEGGWHYDDDEAPTRVTLCPTSCELAQQGAGSADGGVDVEFGCETVLL